MPGVHRNGAVRIGFVTILTTQDPMPGIELEGLPWSQAGLNLLREAVGIAGGTERFLGEPSRGLVVLAAALTGQRKRDDHIRSDGADDAHDIGQDFFLAPFFERLLDTERVAELVSASEVLLGTVDAMNRHELGATEHAEGFFQFGADLILSSVAASDGEQCRSQSTAAAHHHQQPVVLVVRMGGGVHEGGTRPQLAKREGQPGCAAVLRNRLQLRRGAGGKKEQDRQRHQTLAE